MSSWTRDQTEHHLQSVFSLYDLALAFFYTNPILQSKSGGISSQAPAVAKGYLGSPDDQHRVLLPARRPEQRHRGLLEWRSVCESSTTGCHSRVQSANQQLQRGISPCRRGGPKCFDQIGYQPAARKCSGILAQRQAGYR